VEPAVGRIGEKQTIRAHMAGGLEILLPRGVRAKFFLDLPTTSPFAWPSPPMIEK
jgi:hypothetical protein